MADFSNFLIFLVILILSPKVNIFVKMLQGWMEDWMTIQ